MHGKSRAALVAGLMLIVAGATAAQEPRWNWQQGQVLTYQVEHVSKITNTTASGSATSQNQLKVVKRWQVIAVEPGGTATLQLSLASMVMQATTPRGDVMTFDSNNPEGSTPQLREQMKKYVGAPLAVLRIDGTGKVVEVKESRGGAASRFENELPFHALLPAQVPTVNQGWERSYRITVEPPQGTGEKFDAIQRYTCKSITDKELVIAFKTELKTPPEAKADSIPLFNFQPEGEVIFDRATGRMKQATHQTIRELKDHDGPGSSYRFESRYREELIEGR
jgi:hypothetical protein